MTERSIELLQKALALSAEERADLAGSLLNSLEEASDADAASAWHEEISQRVADLDSGSARTIPWSQVQSHIAAILQHGSKKR